MTNKRKGLICLIGALYCLVVLSLMYLIVAVDKYYKTSEPKETVATERAYIVDVQPPKRDMETLVAGSIKSKYVDLISTTALSTSQKYRLPIWFMMAVTCSESEDRTGHINPYAHQKRCNARGCLQITPICLEEYNDWHTVKYTMEDMWNIEINYEVGCWYLARIRDHYLKSCNWTYEDLYLAYNVGPGAFKRYRQDYYNGYDVVHHCEYNALNRYEVYQTKYLNYFN